MRDTPRSPFLVVMVGAAILASCAAPTTYHAAPAVASAHAEGYHEIQVEPDRWRVVFVGNTLTSRETVETYLLYRAAELTLQNGYDWFQAVERDTDEHFTAVVRQSAGAWGQGWEPHWRYASGRHASWRSWDLHTPDPVFDLQQVTAYEATAEIVMRHGVKPMDNERAFDARAVKTSLENRIVRPEA